MTPKNLPTKTPSSTTMERYKLFDPIKEGVQVIDFEYRCAYLNDEITRQSRTVKDEVIGRTMVEAYPGIKNTELFSVIRLCMENRIKQDFETEYIFPDGSKGWFDLRINPVPEGIIIFSFDITEKKEDQKKMELYSDVLLESHDAIISKDLNKKIIGWNRGAEKMFGYTSKEMIGSSVEKLLLKGHENDLEETIRRAKKDEVTTDCQSTWAKKDGSLINVEFTISPLHNEKNEVTSVSIISRDITESKKAELRIKELSDLRGKFIKIISHMLRTPMTSINWNIEEVLRGTFGKLQEAQQQFLQATHDASIKMSSRIDLLLTAIDIEEGRLIIEKEETSIESLVSSVRVELLNDAKIKNINLDLILPEKELPPIEADAEKVRTIIRALISNAISYTKDSGKVLINLCRTDNSARLEISDTGIGIPRVEQHLIFTRFFRASNASVMQPDAFGVSLYIAKTIIEQHNGKIGFDSEENKGSTFWLEIPLKIH